MEKSGVKQSALSLGLNVQQSTVSRWINGHDLPSDERLEEICKLLGCTKEQLFGFDVSSQSSINPEVARLIHEIKEAMNLRSTKYGSDGEGGYHLNPNEYRVIQGKLKDIDAYYPFYDIISAVRKSNLQKRNKIRSLLNLPILENEPRLEAEVIARKKTIIK
ncbi:MAG: hypothetical protein A4S09_07280 [Proteobacteria bacterium SG_bin7]|nr:MAG: hypothetical protein A4S09_07280 [Proteobacteria bacterium SG_bin7]